MLKGCIFDFDGVIMDTEKYHYLAWEKSFHIVNYALKHEEYENLKSTGKNHIIDYVQNKLEKQISKEIVEKIKLTKDLIFDKLIEEISEKDFLLGVLEFIQLLKIQNIKIAVASSSTKARDLIEKYSITNLFDFIVDGNAKCVKKPKPDIFILALNELNIKSNECAVFEDSLVGLEAAKRAGINSVYVGSINQNYSLIQVANFGNYIELLKRMEAIYDK